MKGFELLWIFSCFCFCCQCLCFSFWNYLISWCFFRYCNQINQKEKKEKLEETVLLAKAKLNFIKASVSKALIDFYINHDAIVWVNNVLSEYNEIKENIENTENAVKYTIPKQWKRIVSIVRKILRKIS